MTFQPAPGTLAIAKQRSDNEKLGNVAATYTAQVSCPTDCVFFDGGGCYAESGQIGKFVTEPLNRAAEGATAVEAALAEASTIDAMKIEPGRPMRLHVVGDCATDEAARIVAAAAEWYMAEGGGQVWTYTHAWRTVARESWGLVSVLASCETAGQADEAIARGYAAAIVVEEFAAERRYEIGSGLGHTSDAQHGSLSMLPCPAQTRDRSCSSCRLCFNDRRLREQRIAIGFAVHGIPLAQSRARKALRNPDDPDRRRSVEELVRELLEAEPLLGATEVARRLNTHVTYAEQLVNHIRYGREHPSVMREKRKRRQKARERRLKGVSAAPCSRFALADVQAARGPRRCVCGWTSTLHSEAAKAEWRAENAERKRRVRADWLARSRQAA